MLINNIKTQVEFDLGYNPLIFYGVTDLFKVIVNLAGVSVSYGHISSFINEILKSKPNSHIYEKCIRRIHYFSKNYFLKRMVKA